jgi:hypothetical protein
VVVIERNPVELAAKVQVGGVENSHVHIPYTF